MLIVATSGRVDHMFQVLPDQEDSVSMGDFLSDGLLIVELDSSDCLQDIPKTFTDPKLVLYNITLNNGSLGPSLCYNYEHCCCCRTSLSSPESVPEEHGM